MADIDETDSKLLMRHSPSRSKLEQISKHKSAQRRTEMDTRYQHTMGDSNYDSGFPNNHKKSSQVFKRKHVNTVEDDYEERILPAPSSVKVDSQPLKSV